MGWWGVEMWSCGLLEVEGFGVWEFCILGLFCMMLMRSQYNQYHINTNHFSQSNVAKYHKFNNLSEKYNSSSLEAVIGNIRKSIHYNRSLVHKATERLAGV